MGQVAFYYLLALTLSICTAFGTKKHVHIRIHVPEIIQKVNHEKIIYKHIKKYKHDEKHYHHFGKNIGGGYEHELGGEQSGLGLKSLKIGGFSGKHFGSLGSYHHYGSSEGSSLDHKFGSIGGSSHNHHFGSFGSSTHGHLIGSSVGSSHGHHFGSLRGSSHGHHFGNSGGTSHGHHFGSVGGDHQLGSIGSSSYGHHFGSLGSISHDQFGNGQSGGFAAHLDIPESGKNDYHKGLGSFGYDHEDSSEGSSDHYEPSSGLSSLGKSNGKSLGSSVVSIGHFDFDEHQLEGHDQGWKGLM